MTLQQLFRDLLQDPSYLYLLLEPFTLFGVAVGTFMFVFCWLAKERKARIASLLVIAISSMMILPALHLRKEAEPIPAPTQSDQWMVGTHHERLQSKQWAYYAMTAVAVLAIFLGSGKSGVVFGVLTILGATMIIALSLWLHMHESRIFHPNLRTIDKKTAELSLPSRFSV